MKKILFLLMFMAFCHNLNAQYTIHVLNPWRNDDAVERQENLRISGEPEVGHYPGTDMIPEGNNWFYYTYDTLPKYNPKLQFVNWIGPALHNGRVTYYYKFSVDSIFALASASNDVWIVILDPDSAKSLPTVHDAPPDGKVIKIFNPWPDNSSQMIIGNNPPLKMQRVEEYCGWYEAYYAGSLDRLSEIRFTDFFGSLFYGSDGMVEKAEKTAPIDLEEYFEDYDTVYILPKPFPSGAPSLSPTFPGRTGNCGTRIVSCVFRDWIADNEKSFFVGGGGDSTKEVLLPELRAENNFRPERNPASSHSDAQYVESWYKTKTFDDGSTNETCREIELKKGDDGLWEYDSDWFKGFFLIDDFENPNNNLISDPDNTVYTDPYKKKHNFHFTMEMHLQFKYHEGAGLEFHFTGDDDVWIFINNKMVIDLGGLHQKAKGSVQLDKEKTTLGLKDGEVYSLDIFYAERKPSESNFMIRTSMDIINNDELYTKEKEIAKGKFEYEVWQRVVIESNECGVNTATGEEEIAEVKFYLASPLFDKEEYLDYGGTYYGGIHVDPGKSKVTIDSSALTGLAYGDYQIIFRLGETRSGYLTFSVVPNYHHVDIQVDDMSIAIFDKNKDTKLDTIFMPLETDSIPIYAVLRDPNGLYIERASSAKWEIVSKDTAFTLPRSSTDASMRVIAKQKTGNGYIYAKYENLIYDSVFVITEIDPKWASISSAIMVDNNGDLTPDLLDIILTDTFEIAHKLVSVKINYKGQKYTIPASECTLNKKSLKVPFKSLSGIDGAPTGTVIIEADIEGKTKIRESKFTDGVGAGLIEAAVMENDGTEADILFLTFSENIIPETIKGKQLILIKEKTNDTIQLSVSGNFNKISDSCFSVVLDPSETKPVAGDKLRLVPGSSGGNILDLNKNLPHELNPAVTLELKLGAAPISSSFYEDTDANGLLDKITINFKRKVTFPEFDSVHVYWDLKHLTVPGSKFNVKNDTSVVFSLDESYVGTKPLTDGIMYLAVYFKAIPGVNRNTYALDKASPVLTSATFYPGRFKDSGGDRESDTLIATFSEKVLQPGSKPFVFKNGKDSYSFNLSFLKTTGDKYVFLIKETVPENIMPSSDDTVRIDVSAKVSDTLNNAQLNKQNRPVLLKIVEPAHEWRVKIGPNPMYLSQS
ncbi:MAG: fibro-slime domain-containing protein, partial [Fibrobacter sp.]|nr:fibro-slime domain-containing protein [Fibrobacter sp.]